MDVHSEIVMNPIAFKPHDGAGIIGAVDKEATATRGFAADVISGLSARHKHLPSKYFYDSSSGRCGRYSGTRRRWWWEWTWSRTQRP